MSPIALPPSPAPPDNRPVCKGCGWQLDPGFAIHILGGVVVVLFMYAAIWLLDRLP